MAKLAYTGAEVQSLLDKVNGISGGGSGIAYPLTWSGYSQGVWDGSAPANIAIPSLLSQLTNDEGYIKDVSSDMIVAALGYTPYSSTNPSGYITLSALTPYATTASVNSLLADYLPKSGGIVNGNITATTFLPTGDIAMQFPDGEYIDRWGNFVLPSTASPWSVKNSNMMLLAVRNDGEIQLNGTIHFTKEVPMIKMVENGWAQSKVMWHGWDSTEGDSLWLQIPSGVENDVYFKLCRLAPSILNTSLQVNGNLLVTGEVTQHSSLELKDVVGTRFLTLKELAELKPYSFYWKDGRDDELHAGAVADYVMPILPEVISTDKDNIHSMNYANAAWVVGTSLTPYVSKHEEDIDWLKARVRYLEDKLKEC